jgi:hypothetical protein
MRPGVAVEYLDEVTEGFEAYAERVYLGALNDPRPDPDHLLAGIRFVGTRDIDGYGDRLHEILTTRFPRRVKSKIDAACIDALIATTEDPQATARHIARGATERTPMPPRRLAEDALRRLGPAACEALLVELARPSFDAARVRRLAGLLTSVCRVPSPDPVGAWARADPQRRQQAVDAWRRRLQAAGRLP